MQIKNVYILLFVFIILYNLDKTRQLLKGYNLAKHIQILKWCVTVCGLGSLAKNCYAQQEFKHDVCCPLVTDRGHFVYISFQVPRTNQLGEKFQTSQLGTTSIQLATCIIYFTHQWFSSSSVLPRNFTSVLLINQLAFYISTYAIRKYYKLDFLKNQWTC